MKIAIINQRYGLEVNGGSELYTRLIAEQLSKKYEVEVLTTCALDYITWENYYMPGTEKINDIAVRRFPVARERNKESFLKINKKLFNSVHRASAVQEMWIDEQGPYCPAFLEFLKTHQNDYDVFIFVTYLYWLSVRGLPLVEKKSILVPTAHDEPTFYLSVYKKIIEHPKSIIFLTENEHRLVHENYNISDIFCADVGVGIELPYKINAAAFLEKYKIDFPYMIYVGRIDESKGCGVLFQYFLEYKTRNPSSKLKLVLMGNPVMEIPVHKDIVSLGFVSDEDKYAGIAASEFMVLPSRFESLSISTLEAMALGRTVLVNGKCKVLKGHCKKSNAALYYNNYFEYEGEINWLMSHTYEKSLLEQNAKRYVEENYQWDVIMKKYDDIIEYVAKNNRT